MCLAVPGKIVSIDNTASNNPLMKTGKVDFGGIQKDINLAYVPDAVIGEYVIVHVGFALSKIDEQAALQVFEDLKEFDLLEELEETEA